MKNHTLNFSAFDFQEATFEERYQCWRANSDSWAGKLSKEDYVAREALNGNQSLTRNRAQRYWVFKGPKYQGPEGETSIYSSVETFRKEVVSKFANGTFKKYIAYGIASVFTIPEHRGKGVASAMMERLAQWLDSDEAECDFSVLYSDIGEYYAPLGWPSYSSLEITLSPATHESSSSVKVLSSADVRSLTMDDVERVSEHIQSSPLNEGDEVRLAFLPTYNQAEWHFACEDFMSSKLFNTSRKPSIKGAMAKCGRAWAYWVHDFNDDKLILLRLHAESGTPDTTSPGALPLQVSIVDILWAAQQEAHSWELEKVVVWDPSPLVLAACKEVLGRELAPRRRADGSIPCLRWKGGENKKVDWVYIEKYSWC